MVRITQTQVAVLQAAFTTRHPRLGLTHDQVDVLFTVPSQPADFECWFKAIMYLVQTGDLMGAVMKMIQCLLSSGRRQQEDIFGCIIKAVLAMLQGVPINEALISLIKCIFGTPTQPPPPGPPGEIPPYEGRDVDRC